MELYKYIENKGDHNCKKMQENGKKMARKWGQTCYASLHDIRGKWVE